MTGRFVRGSLLALGLLLPALALAQENAGISGTVTDTTGAVLPGVTVEASSPALIEGVRTAVTGGNGAYSITGLRPGTYKVSFSLTGFSVAVREGITLTPAFTAPVNAQLKVGSLEETVTVTGASPTVDVQNVRTQTTITREVLDQLPNAQTISAMAALTLGTNNVGVTSQDVGGTGGEMGVVSVHMNRLEDMKITMEGMNTNNSMGTNGGQFHAGQHYNMEAMQAVTMAHNGMTADTETAGAQVNYIPKDGGNSFSGSGRATFASEGFQSDNLTDDLKARGVTTATKVKGIYDYGGSLGGPIAKDKLWFYTAHRWWGNSQYQPGAFFNKTQGGHVWTKDTSRRGYREDYNQDNSGRVTWQATGKDKIAYYGNLGRQCVCFLAISATLAPEATLNNHLPENHLSQATWNRVQSNRLLIEAGFTYLHNPFSFRLSPGGTHEDIPHIEVTTGEVWNAFPSGGLPYNDYDGPGGGPAQAGQQNGRVALSYVTGSHSFKAGYTMAHGLVVQNGKANEVPGFGPAAFLLFAGRPILINQFANPKYNRSDFRNQGIFAQDQWRISRLTLNLGVRFDLFDGWSPTQTTPDTPFVKGFTTQRIEGTPTWRDVSPRLGMAYDLKGDGRTAIKVSAGRYVAAAGAGTVQPTNPALAISTDSLRSWNDADGDWFPDADELGPLFNANFGKPVINTFFDPDYLTKNRGYTWQTSAGIERQLTQNLGLSVTYFRTAHFNQTVTDNTLVGPADFDQFSVVIPRGLPGAGTRVSGLYDVSQAKFGQVRNLVRAERTFGDKTEVYNGVDIGLNSRFRNGAILQGGVSVGKSVTDNCFVVDSPQQEYQCKVELPWWDGMGQVKLAGSYPLPFGIELSAVYQNLPGVQILANGVFTSSDVSGLGRPLTGATATVPLIQPGTMFEKRVNQIDFRLGGVVRSPMGRVRLTLDLYNMTNSATVLGRNNTFSTAAAGAGWGTPTTVMPGRLLKLGAQLSF